MQKTTAFHFRNKNSFGMQKGMSRSARDAVVSKKKEDSKNNQKIKKHLDNVARGMGRSTAS